MRYGYLTNGLICRPGTRLDTRGIIGIGGAELGPGVRYRSVDSPALRPAMLYLSFHLNELSLSLPLSHILNLNTQLEK